MTNERVARILILDTLEDEMSALRTALGAENVILEARSRAEALERLRHDDVAVAFIGLSTEGFELAEVMRAAPRTARIPIVFITSAGDHPRRTFQGCEAAPVGFLQRPLEPYLVRHQASTFAELHRQRYLRRAHEEIMDTVGHDLRNPLHAILMTAELLSTTSSDEEAVDAARRIAASGQRMVRMIDDALDASCVGLGLGIPLVLASTDLGALAHQVVAEHRAKNPARLLLLERRGDLSGIWDAERLRQALSSLIGNALVHGDARGPVSIGADGDATTVTLSVHNEGAISEERLPRFFEPTPSAPVRKRATGLGLHVVRQIVAAHAGALEIESEAPFGTTLSMKLPRRTASP